MIKEIAYQGGVATPHFLQLHSRIKTGSSLAKQDTFWGPDSLFLPDVLCSSEQMETADQRAFSSPEIEGSALTLCPFCPGRNYFYIAKT